MRTTLDLPKELLDELMGMVGGKTKGAAVATAIEEYIRHRKLAELKASSGKVRLLHNWRELERSELREAREGV